MAEIRVAASSDIAAEPDQVFRAILDYGHRPQWLPPAFSNLEVADAGGDEGLVVAYHLKVGSRERDYRMKVTVIEPDRALLENDLNSSLRTRWAVQPSAAGSRVSIVTTWQGAGGIGGLFERRFAPRALQAVYDQALVGLDRYLHG